MDAELLLATATGQSRGQLQAKIALGAEVTADQELRFQSFLERRAGREPLQHIVGRAPFRNLDLAVGPGVFVPRPETELTAQIAIDSLLGSATPSPIAVDLGTGSGAIAISLATEVPHSQVFAIEKSPSAFEWAKRNSAESGVRNLRIELGDLAAAFDTLNGTVDVVVSNPPYIPIDAIPREPEVRLFDPPEALYGGRDGLEIIRQISKVGLRLLRPGGILVIEHGELQGAEIRSLLGLDSWRAPHTIRDLLNRDRVTTAIR